MGGPQNKILLRAPIWPEAALEIVYDILTVSGHTDTSRLQSVLCAACVVGRDQCSHLHELFV